MNTKKNVKGISDTAGVGGNGNYIKGNVSTQSRANVAGVWIRATGNNGNSYKGKTDASGNYAITNVPAGTYSVCVNCPVPLTPTVTNSRGADDINFVFEEPK